MALLSGRSGKGPHRCGPSSWPDARNFAGHGGAMTESTAVPASVRRPLPHHSVILTWLPQSVGLTPVSRRLTGTIWHTSTFPYRYPRPVLVVLPLHSSQEEPGRDLKVSLSGR